MVLISDREQRCSARPQLENFRRLRAISLTDTVLRLLGLRAGPLAIGAITVWIVRRPSRRAHSQALAAGAIGSAPCAPASNPWIWYDCVEHRALIVLQDVGLRALLLAIGGMLLGL